MLKRIEVYKESGFSEKGLNRYLVHDSPYFKVLNFNFKKGQELPVHSHAVSYTHLTLPTTPYV